MDPSSHVMQYPREVLVHLRDGTLHTSALCSQVAIPHESSDTVGAQFGLFIYTFRVTLFNVGSYTLIDMDCSFLDCLRWRWFFILKCITADNFLLLMLTFTPSILGLSYRETLYDGNNIYLLAQSVSLYKGLLLFHGHSTANKLSCIVCKLGGVFYRSRHHVL